MGAGLGSIFFFYHYMQKGLWKVVNIESENDTNCSPHPKVPFLMNLLYLSIYLSIYLLPPLQAPTTVALGEVATLPKHVSRGFGESMCLCPEVAASAMAGDIVGENAQVLPRGSSDLGLHSD